MAKSNIETPPNRCGFELKPVDVDFRGAEETWKKLTSPSCCWRTVWESEDETEYCIWHAKVDEKPINELRRQKLDRPECLDGAILRGVSQAFEHLSFRDCGLRGATVEDCTIHDGYFNNSNIIFAEFINTELLQTRFSRAIAAHASFHSTTFRQSSFGETDFSQVTFNECSFSQNIFGETDFCQAMFNESDFSQNTFRDVDFSRAVFDTADLRQETLSNLDFQKVEFSHTDLSSAKFPGADLTKAKFPHADLTQATFSDADLGMAAFSNAELSQTDFTGANIQVARFPHTDIVQADFSDANLSEAKFPHAQIIQTDFSDANLEKVKLYNSTLRQTKFHSADLQKADLTDADAREARFQRAALHDAVFSGSDCRGAIFTDAYLYEAVFEDTRINSETVFYDSDITPPNCIYQKKRERLEYELSVAPLEAAQWVYRRLESLHEANALSDEARKFHISKEEAERKFHKKQHRFGSWSVKSLMWWLTKHGESARRVLYWWAFVIGTSGILFAFTDGVQDGSGKVYVITSIRELGTIAGRNDLLMNLYFSMTTFSTIMDGGLAPAGTATRAIVAGESIIGALLVALFVFVLGRQTAR